MGLKKSHGNMYPWVTHMHTHLEGECPHRCVYCYVQKNPHGIAPKYRGPLRFNGDELKIPYGSGKTIFIEHMNDLFAADISSEWIDAILRHCKRWPGNNYVFQTKDPTRALFWLEGFPTSSLIGTTIETNVLRPLISNAPLPQFRYEGILKIRKCGWPVFVTIEPIMDFDVEILSDWFIAIHPSFINIGADSKVCDLPEPPPEKIRELISRIKKAGIEIRKKTNLARLGIQ